MRGELEYAAAMRCAGSILVGLALFACRSAQGVPDPVVDGVAPTVTMLQECDGLTVSLQGVPKGTEDLVRDATRELIEQCAAAGGAPAYLDDAAYELQLALRNEGFPAAEVSFTRTKAANRTDAVLEVKAGRRVTIAGVVLNSSDGLNSPDGLSGSDGVEALPGPAAKALPVGELRAIFGAPETRLLGGNGEWIYSAERARRAPARIVEVLEGAGYLDAEARLLELDPAATGDQVLRVEISLGERYRLTDIELSFEGDTLELEQRAALEAECKAVITELLGSGRDDARPYQPNSVRTLYGRLVDTLERLGHPEAVVQIETKTDQARARVRLRAEVIPGPRVVVTDVLFAGHKKTRPRFLASRVETEKGDVLNGDVLRRDVRRLYRTGLFGEVRTRLEGEGTQRELVFDLLERKSRELWIEPGYGSYELFRISTGYRERNLFGTGRGWRAEGTAALRALRVSSTLTDPRLFGQDLIGDLRIDYDRRDEPSFVRLQRGVGAFVTKEWGGRVTTSVGYQFRRSEVRAVEVQNAELEDDQNVVDLSTVRITHRIDRRDDSFVPTEGGFAEVALEYGSSALGSELDFVRSTLSLAGYHALGRRNVLAAGVRTGLISPFGNDDSIPLQERFFVGGENSVRSFTESKLGPKDRAGRPSGGEAFLTGSLELRHALYGNLQGALFADAGTLVEQHNELLQFRDVGTAVGLGLRYLLPIGPLRVDVAANPDPASGEDDWAAHFSIGMAF